MGYNLFMSTDQEPVYFIHMSDTHIGSTVDFERHGFNSWTAARRAVNMIKSFTQRPDFVIHTGDVVADPVDEAYRLAADLMAELDVPVYYAVGNHDSSVGVRDLLNHGPYEALGDDPTRHIYGFSVKGSEFMVLDGRAPDELDPHGCLGGEQLAIVRQKTAEVAAGPLTIFVHFPALPFNSPWFDQNMLLLDGEELHDILCQSPREIRGVFYGHVHMPLQTRRNGILYSAAPSTFANFAAWPNKTEPEFLDEPPGFSFVQLLPNQLMIRHHGFKRP